MKWLCEEGSLQQNEIASRFKKQGLGHSEGCLNTIERILNLEWFPDQQRKTFGGTPLAIREGSLYRLTDEFRSLYESYAPDWSPSSFRSHVDDVIETGLLLNRKHYGSSDKLIRGKRYSRRDTCRLLNWAKNQESTIYGYKTDPESGTCPIFITYHKDADISESIRYEDTLLNQSTLHWFSRNRRTLESRELQPILSNAVDLHLFAKREDADGTDFYYLGQVDATNPQQTTMLGKNDTKVDVVTTDLKLRVPMPVDLFESLTARKNVAATP